MKTTEKVPDFQDGYRTGKKEVADKVLPVLEEAGTVSIYLDYKNMAPETVRKCKKWGSRIDNLITELRAAL